MRSEAGRWLGKLNRGGPNGARPEQELERVHSELLRLRYGRKETWPEPREVFRRARRTARVVWPKRNYPDKQ